MSGPPPEEGAPGEVAAPAEPSGRPHFASTKKARGGFYELPPAPVVILARPQMGENVGAACRAMLNFGLTELRLVAPQFGWPNAKAIAAASGAVEILNHMRLFETVAEASADLSRLYATTARPRDLAKPVLTAEAAASAARASFASGGKTGYLFGPERTGLDNDELILADAIVTIPLNPLFASLNLAQAVLIAGYEWHRSGDATPPVVEPELEPAPRGELQALLDHLLSELDARGYFRSETRKASLARTIKASFERRAMSRAEVSLWRGMIKDLTTRPRKD